VKEAANQGGARMFYATLRTLTKVVVTSLVVGMILAHFGMTTDHLMHAVGLSTERVEDYARKGFAWASSNLLLGALVTVPIWFLIFLFRPPGQSSSK
jgi:Domain of unknown function (DUF6460)